ncbi:hypothetical protein [Halorussus lipolyticus]|uniref:hypothetical protein n=1 Tax=Halorussus lipolyticus TaxID=3034024 RepID=UPI0023E8102D|nr:hypothetical protein [Halorussus sp. DT80]
MTADKPVFIRRKFTITESLDRTLQELATRHYQGNVSLCLRASIESHREILQGDGQFAVNQISRQLESLDQGQHRLESLVDELTELEDERSATSQQSVIEGVRVSSETAAIYNVLCEQDTPLRIEDIVERTGGHMEAFQEGLSTLVDLGLVGRTDDPSPRYQLVGKLGSEANRDDSV